MSDEQKHGEPAPDPELSNAEPLVLREGDAPAAPSAATPEPPAPTHADWRQLSDEVRRLAAQLAYGRA